MQYTWSLLKRKMTVQQKGKRHRDTPQRCRQNKQEDHHCYIQSSILFPYTVHTQHTSPPIYPPVHPSGQPTDKSLPRLDLSGQAMGYRRERVSHATGAGTGAPPGGIYSRPALKGRERGHACFPFHSPGTFTRPHMWVLNIYPNTGSSIVGAENRR